MSKDIHGQITVSEIPHDEKEFYPELAKKNSQRRIYAVLFDGCLVRLNPAPDRRKILRKLRKTKKSGL